MKRSAIKPMPEYFDRYINLLEDDELDIAFEKSMQEVGSLDIDLLNKIGNRGYAQGKWSVKEIFQHIIDVERIFCYRALLMARNDSTRTAGFEQDLLVQTSEANKRAYAEIIDEFKTVRASTVSLFKSFSNEMLQRKGINWKYEISVLAMGFLIIGHQAHHFNIIRKNYYPLAL